MLIIYFIFSGFDTLKKEIIEKKKKMPCDSSGLSVRTSRRRVLIKFA